MGSKSRGGGRGVPLKKSELKGASLLWHLMTAVPSTYLAHIPHTVQNDSRDEESPWQSSRSGPHSSDPTG